MGEWLFLRAKGHTIVVLTYREHLQMPAYMPMYGTPKVKVYVLSIYLVFLYYWTYNLIWFSTHNNRQTALANRRPAMHFLHKKFI